MTDAPHLLRTVSTFRRLSEADLGLIAAQAGSVRLEPGSWVYREGDAADGLYVVAEGEVEAVRGEGGGAYTVARYLTGESFGEADLWSRATRETGARTACATTLISFPRPGATIEDLERLHPELFVRVLWLSIAEIAGRIRSTNALISTKTPWIRALETLMFTDALTGLPNRRWIDERLRAVERGTPVALVVVKPDLFKAVNDRYGHDEGDRALQAVAAEMRRLVSAPNAASRLTGDEFAVLAPGTAADGARALAAHLLKELSRFTVKIPGAPDSPLGFRSGAAWSRGGAPDVVAIADRAHEHVLRARAGGAELIHD